MLGINNIFYVPHGTACLHRIHNMQTSDYYDISLTLEITRHEHLPYLETYTSRVYRITYGAIVTHSLVYSTTAHCRLNAHLQHIYFSKSIRDLNAPFTLKFLNISTAIFVSLPVWETEIFFIFLAVIVTFHPSSYSSCRFYVQYVFVHT